MTATTINVPVSIPVGVPFKLEHLQKRLTVLAMSLIQQERNHSAQAEGTGVSKFVQSIGRAVDLSEMESEKDAYRKHLAEKYA